MGKDKGSGGKERRRICNITANGAEITKYLGPVLREEGSCEAD